MRRYLAVIMWIVLGAATMQPAPALAQAAVSAQSQGASRTPKATDTKPQPASPKAATEPTTLDLEALKTELKQT